METHHKDLALCLRPSSGQRVSQGLAGKMEGRDQRGACLREGGACSGQVTSRRAASPVEILQEAEALRCRPGWPGLLGQRGGRGHGGLERRTAESHLARLHRARLGPQRQGLQVATQGEPPAGASRRAQDPRRYPQGGLVGNVAGRRSSLFLQASGRCAGAGVLLRLPRRLRCAPRGAAGPAGRPRATGWMGARDLSLTSPPRRPQTLGLVRARAERPVMWRLPAKAIAFVESSLGLPKDPRV